MENNEEYFKNKYYKYKLKYLQLKGGNILTQWFKPYKNNNNDAYSVYIDSLKECIKPLLKDSQIHNLIYKPSDKFMETTLNRMFGTHYKRKNKEHIMKIRLIGKYDDEYPAIDNHLCYALLTISFIYFGFKIYDYSTNDQDFHRVDHIFDRLRSLYNNRHNVTNAPQEFVRIKTFFEKTPKIKDRQCDEEYRKSYGRKYCK